MCCIRTRHLPQRPQQATPHGWVSSASRCCCAQPRGRGRPSRTGTNFSARRRVWGGADVVGWLGQHASTAAPPVLAFLRTNASVHGKFCVFLERNLPVVCTDHISLFAISISARSALGLVVCTKSAQTYAWLVTARARGTAEAAVHLCKTCAPSSALAEAVAGSGWLVAGLGVHTAHRPCLSTGASLLGPGAGLVRLASTPPELGALSSPPSLLSLLPRRAHPHPASQPQPPTTNEQRAPSSTHPL